VSRARVIVRIGKDTFTIELLPNGGARLVDGERVLIEGIGDGAYRVSTDERSWRVFVAEAADRRWVFCDGHVYEAEIVREGRATRKPSAGHHDSLSAPMPATIVRIVTSAGQAVLRGETLLVLEAMKMELPVKAPHDGIVAAIHCREGERVQAGATLLDFQ
jgi:biotin carboxyl carrier protein